MTNHLNNFLDPLFNPGLMASAVSCSSRSLYYEPNNGKENDLKIRPRFVNENFRSRYTQFEIQNIWGFESRISF